MLSGLRTVSVAEASGLGVPVQQPPSWSGLRRRAAESARRLATRGEIHDDLVVRLPQLTEVAPCTRPARVLTHGDLKGEHILVDENGAVSDVLDWTDAEIGDPATDIAGLAIAVGAAAATRSARAADYDDAACARGVFLARCNTILLLDDRVRDMDDSPLPLLRGQLARAWERTPLEA